MPSHRVIIPGAAAPAPREHDLHNAALDLAGLDIGKPGEEVQYPRLSARSQARKWRMPRAAAAFKLSCRSLAPRRHGDAAS